MAGKTDLIFAIILKFIEDLQESVGFPFVTRKNNGTAKCPLPPKGKQDGCSIYPCRSRHLVYFQPCVQNYLQDDHLARFVVIEAMGLVKRGTISLDGTKLVPFMPEKREKHIRPLTERFREDPAAHQNATAVQAMRHWLQVR